jgi:hypothetical protein
VFGKLADYYMNTDVVIKFVRASQKLKAYTGPFIACSLKNKYSQRKWLSVKYTEWFLTEKFNKDQCDIWGPFFQSKAIKPDLGDTFLMCVNVIYGIPKKQTQNKNGSCIK